MIEHEASLCTGCTACAYVCAPKAITARGTDGAAVTWKFFAGQCSFCGLCVQYCPTARDHQPRQAAAGDRRPALHGWRTRSSYQPCARVLAARSCRCPSGAAAQLYERGADRGGAASNKRCARRAAAGGRARRFATRSSCRAGADTPCPRLTRPLAAIARPGRDPLDGSARATALWISRAPDLDVAAMAREMSRLGFRLCTMTGLAAADGETTVIYHFVRPRGQGGALQDAHARRHAAVDRADVRPASWSRARDPRLLRRHVRGPPESRPAAAAGGAEGRLLPRRAGGRRPRGERSSR